MRKKLRASEEAMADNGSGKTLSEQFFETYLSEHSLTDFDYEPDIKGTGRSCQ
jgi:hypothetical protein